MLHVDALVESGYGYADGWVSPETVIQIMKLMIIQSSMVI